MTDRCDQIDREVQFRRRLTRPSNERSRILKALADLQSECARLGITVQSNGRRSKEPWISALREYHWDQEHPGTPLPAQVQPMLLGNWQDLDPAVAEEMESHRNSWIVQPKLDGVRVLFHVEENGVRITGRSFSEVTFRLTEHQDTVSHLTVGLEAIRGTILDGELVCPSDAVDTGSTITTQALQATVAILATSPENAKRIQCDDGIRLRLHVFDILRHSGQDVTSVPLHDRIKLLTHAVGNIENRYIELVPSFEVDKAAVHERIIEQGGEGTVWKNIHQPYEPGRRVKHWIKRKRSLETEAFVSGFKPGTPGHGNSHLIGAIEFSVENDGETRPIAWISNLTDAERQDMTENADDTQVRLRPEYLGRRAVIVGQDESSKSRRLRHARIKKWMDR